MQDSSPDTALLIIYFADTNVNAAADAGVKQLLFLYICRGELKMAELVPLEVCPIHL